MIISKTNIKCKCFLHIRNNFSVKSIGDIMITRASDLYNREVICVKDGARLGIISDITINCADGKVESVVIYGRSRMCGILGRDDDVVIRWEDIEVFGDDTVLVKCEMPKVYKRQKKGIIPKIFD